MTLLGMDVTKGAMKVCRIQREMLDRPAGLVPWSLTLPALIQTFFPVAPVSPQECFFFLLRRAVEFIARGQGEAQGLLELSENEIPGHELAVANGAEALLVKIIRHAISADFFQTFLSMMNVLLAQIMSSDSKPVAADVLGSERLGHSAQVFNVQSGLVQFPFGTMKNGEVLNGEGVAILEAAEGNAMPLDFPAPPNELQSVER